MTTQKIALNTALLRSKVEEGLTDYIPVLDGLELGAETGETELSLANLCHLLMSGKKATGMSSHDNGIYVEFEDGYGYYATGLAIRDRFDPKTRHLAEFCVAVAVGGDPSEWITSPLPVHRELEEKWVNTLLALGPSHRGPIPLKMARESGFPKVFDGS